MNLDNIPEEIKRLHRWVCARANSKLPMMATEPYPASSVDMRTWSSYQIASASVAVGNYDYVGFVFADDGIVGIDIDDGFDEYGLLTERAVDIIGKCCSYTEKSKSGSGLHILVKGDLPFSGRNNLRGVEIYKQSRYFIMTGDILMFDTIVENQSAIDYIVDKYFPSVREGSSDKHFADRIYTPIWEKPHGKIKLRPIYPRIPDGCRNICLTSLAGMMHNQGYEPRQIYNELQYCNTVACDPMLPCREIETIVKSVTKYKR